MGGSGKRRQLALGAVAILALGVVGIRLAPYLTYGLNAAHIEEMDPFRIRHGGTFSIPAEQLSYASPKDRIPALTDPAFVPATAAPDWLTDDARVIGVMHDGIAKAYPELILLWHEVVNDTVGGKPYLVTF